MLFSASTTYRDDPKNYNTSNPGFKFSHGAGPSSRSLSLSLFLSLDLHTAPGSRQGSLYLHSNVPGRPHSAIILFRSFSRFSRIVLFEHRLSCTCERANALVHEFSAPNYVTRRRVVPDIALASRDVDRHNVAYNETVYGDGCNLVPCVSQLISRTQTKQFNLTNRKDQPNARVDTVNQLQLSSIFIHSTLEEPERFIDKIKDSIERKIESPTEQIL